MGGPVTAMDPLTLDQGLGRQLPATLLAVLYRNVPGTSEITPPMRLVVGRSGTSGATAFG